MKILAAFSLLACAAAQAQTTPVTCSAATLTGTRSIVLTGRNLSTGAFLKSYYGAGQAIFDGSSNVTMNLTTDTNSAQNVAQNLAGTYTIASNCIGTLTISTGDFATFTLIPYDSGKSFTLTGYDANYDFSGSGATPPSACVTATLSGNYAYSGNGFSIVASVISGIYTSSGLLTFDGAGSISGSWSLAENGVRIPVSVTGNYSVTSSCLASATLADNSGNSYSVAFTLTSADGANFTAVGSSAADVFEITGHSTYLNPAAWVGNSAGVTGGTPPGSLFSIYGYNLATGTDQPITFPLPTTAANATVTINGEAVPLVYVDPGQINAQMPLDIRPGVATLSVQVGNSMNGLSATSNAVAITVPSTPVPGVYVDGTNHAVAQNYPSYDLNSGSDPAAVGDVIIVYLNGGGAVQGESSIVTGHATPDGNFPVTASYSATIGGIAANVEFIGLVPGIAGLYQANIVIPDISAGAHTLVITIGGVASNSSNVNTK